MIYTLKCIYFFNYIMTYLELLLVAIIYYNYVININMLFKNKLINNANNAYSIIKTT